MEARRESIFFFFLFVVGEESSTYYVCTYIHSYSTYDIPPTRALYTEGVRRVSQDNKQSTDTLEVPVERIVLHFLEGPAEAPHTTRKTSRQNGSGR